MNTWEEAQAAVLTGTQTTWQDDWANLNEGLVLYQGSIWLAGDTYISQFTPTPAQENAMNWVIAAFDGSLPPR
jgi:hypothetical protein